MSKDARIGVGVDGAADASRQLSGLFDPLEKAAGKVGGAVGKAFGEIGSAVAGVVQDSARAITVLNTIDLAGSAAKYTQFTTMIARGGVALGASVDTLKARFKDLSDATGISDEVLAKFSLATSVATHDSKNNADAVRALARESLATGKSLEQMGAIGVSLHNDFGVTFSGMEGALENIRAQAEKFGTVGGPSALQDRIVALGAAISTVAMKGQQDLQSLVTFSAAVGKNLRPQQQQQVQQRLLGFLTTNTEPLRRQLHMTHDQFYDKDGNVKDATGLALKVKQDAVKRYGGQENALRIMSQEGNLGPQAAAALFNLTSADMATGKGALSRGAADETTKYRQSAAGQAEALRNKIAASHRDEAGKPLSEAQDYFGDMFKDHPFLGYVASNVGLRLGAKALGGIAGMFGGGGATAAAVAGGEAVATGTGAATTLGLGALTPVAAFLATTGLGLAALGGATGELNENMPQIKGETQKQLEVRQAGRARAVLRAVERGGGEGAEGVERELGPATLNAVKGDPQLASLLSQVEKGQSELSGLSAVIANAVREGLKGSPLEAKITVTDATLDASTRNYSVSRTGQ